MQVAAEEMLLRRTMSDIAQLHGEVEQCLYACVYAGPVTYVYAHVYRLCMLVIMQALSHSDVAACMCACIIHNTHNVLMSRDTRPLCTSHEYR
jgi:hypothetical protein